MSQNAIKFTGSASGHLVLQQGLHQRQAKDCSTRLNLIPKQSNVSKISLRSAKQFSPFRTLSVPLQPITKPSKKKIQQAVSESPRLIMTGLTLFTLLPSQRLVFDPWLSWGMNKKSSKFRHSASSKQNHVLNYY